MIANSILRPDPKAIWVFGYGRSSDNKQELTIDAQYDICTDWFQLQVKVGALPDTAVWMGFFADEAVSSKIGWFERPMGGKVCSMARRGDVIVSAKFDRPCRDPRDWYDIVDIINKRRIRLVIVDTPGLDCSTPNGRLVANILSAFKLHEREMIAARTKDALAAKIKRGLPVGCIPPFGWKKVGLKRDSRFVPDNDQRRLGYYIVHLRDVEGLSFEAISLRNIRERFGVNTIHGRYRNTLWTESKLRKLYLLTKAGFPKKNGDRVDTIQGITAADVDEISRRLYTRKQKR